MRIGEHLYLVGSEQFGLSHPLDCNCYLIDGGSALALVDTGFGLGVDDILANMQADGFDPARLTHILITHAHYGHFGGAAELRERTGAQIGGPALGADILRDPYLEPGMRYNIKFDRYPPGFEAHACPPDFVFDDGDTFAVGDISLKVIVVQGHTKDSTCFLFEDGGKRGLLTGDVVFYGGKLGLLNLEGFSMDDYRRDIHKLTDLGVDMLLPGHSVFVLRRGQSHIRRAAHKLGDFVMPETFFETNEFMWERDYLKVMSE
ncbi:MAG: MBL fold metallo-hydrolase [Anaerolineae bacterium]|nr:MBL fold metallo-hydrolase [Anaerolineae bacterium]